jgi:hypothetical protein
VTGPWSNSEALLAAGGMLVAELRARTLGALTWSATAGVATLLLATREHGWLRGLDILATLCALPSTLFYAFRFRAWSRAR